MRLGFHYHIPATLKQDGKIYMPGYLGVFIDSLADQVESIVCFMHSPLESELVQMDYALQVTNVVLHDIGPHVSMHKRILYPRAYIKKITPHLEGLDLMLIRGPSPLLPVVAAECARKSLPYAYLLVGDYLKSLAGVKGMNPIKRFLLWSFYHRNKQLQDAYASNALIFVNNKLMYDECTQKYKNTHEIRTTTLSKQDFYQREDTCQSSPIRLAFAGRIEPAKGIEDMLNAVKILNDKHIDTELHIAGWDPGKSDQYLHKLQQLATSMGLSGKFHYHGKKTVGPELFGFYRRCDIFLVASTGNEGFPRTIWEAMAQSMPVIATRVGSIPDLLTDGENALLIDQHQPSHIAEAVKKLLTHIGLRKNLISNGCQYASKNTLEIQAEKMIEQMRGYNSAE